MALPVSTQHFPPFVFDLSWDEQPDGPILPMEATAAVIQQMPLPSTQLLRSFSEAAPLEAPKRERKFYRQIITEHEYDLIRAALANSSKSRRWKGVEAELKDTLPHINFRRVRKMFNKRNDRIKMKARKAEAIAANSQAAAAPHPLHQVNRSSPSSTVQEAVQPPRDFQGNNQLSHSIDPSGTDRDELFFASLFN